MRPVLQRGLRRIRLGLGLSALAAAVSHCAAGGDDDFLSTLLKGPKTTIEPGTFLELGVVGPLHDGPGSSPFAQFGAPGAQSIWEARRGLLAAAKDSRIVGMKLEIEQTEMGFGALDELSESLAQFREAGKPIYAYLRNDFVDDGGYYLALDADRIYVAPQSALMVNGLRAEVTFWRGTLQKLGIVPNVLMMKEYKSAGEIYGRSSMSDAFRESLTAVLTDLEGRLATKISERRGLPPVQVRAGLDSGLMTTAQALETGWIDGLGYRDQVERDLVKAAKSKRYEGIEFRKYMRSIDDGDSDSNPLSKLGLKKEPALAVVFGEGPIVAQEGGGPFEDLFGGDRILRGLDVAKAIDEASEDEGVKAILFRVDSPGGSAVGSDHVLDAIRRAQARGKKVVVSMGTVAGSGGYWVSMGADQIIAEPSTITGSIGVVFVQFDVRGFYDWIGAHVDSVSISKGSGMMSEFEDFEGPRKERWTAWMTAVYEDFKKQVAHGRKLSVEQVEERAKGRIWSGTDALEKGLVDSLGGITTAIQVACKLGGLGDPKKVKLEIFPRKNLVEQLFGDLFAGARVASSPLDLLKSFDPTTLRALTKPRVLVLLPQIDIE